MPRRPGITYPSDRDRRRDRLRLADRLLRGGHPQIERGNGHPLFYTVPAVSLAPFPDGGGYAIDFLPFAYKELGFADPQRVLHVCSGSVQTGIRIDVRASTRPDVIADAEALPFVDESFRWVLADPPYSPEYAEQLYGTGALYPRPSKMLGEIARVLRPGGRAGFLHFLVPRPPEGAPLVLVRVVGCTFGCGYNIRAFSVWERPAETVPLFGSPIARAGV